MSFAVTPSFSEAILGSVSHRELDDAVRTSSKLTRLERSLALVPGEPDPSSPGALSGGFSALPSEGADVTDADVVSLQPRTTSAHAQASSAAFIGGERRRCRFGTRRSHRAATCS